MTENSNFALLSSTELFFDSQWIEVSTLAFIIHCYIIILKPNNYKKKKKNHKSRHLKILTTTLYSKRNLRRKMVILHLGKTNNSFGVLYPFHTGVIPPCHVIIFQKLLVLLCCTCTCICILASWFNFIMRSYPYSFIAQIPSWCKFHLYMLGGGYSPFDEHPIANFARIM